MSKGSDTWDTGPTWHALEQDHLPGWTWGHPPPASLPTLNSVSVAPEPEISAHIGAFWSSEESCSCSLSAGKSCAPGGCSGPELALEPPSTQKHQWSLRVLRVPAGWGCDSSLQGLVWCNNNKGENTDHCSLKMHHVLADWHWASHLTEIPYLTYCRRYVRASLVWLAWAQC